VIYFVANIVGQHEWAWRAREWALALEPLDMRIYSTDRVVLQREIFAKEHQGVLDIATRPPGPSHCAIRFGPVESLMQLDDPAPHEVAIVDWWSDRIPPRVARVLGRYDQLWVPNECQVPALLEAVKGPVVIPDPVNLGAWHDASPLEEHPGETILYAIGHWGFPDHLELAARAFHDVFELEDPVRLLLVCPDCPIQTAEDLHATAAWAPPGRRVSPPRPAPRSSMPSTLCPWKALMGSTRLRSSGQLHRPQTSATCSWRRLGAKRKPSRSPSASPRS
jgi:hypothetical protein